jgi:hypoxanthine phosphoribosyltransferase
MDASAGLHCLFPRTEIDAAVGELAGEITAAYAGSNPVLVGVLKGAFVFMADLVRRLDFPLEMDFVRLASYGGGQETSGQVSLELDLRADIRGREVLVVEDIVDTGLTTAFLLEHLNKREPASLRLCALADKPSRRRAPVSPDYRGFTVPDRFLVGYGLDCDEQYRNLPDIYCLEA